MFFPPEELFFEFTSTAEPVEDNIAFLLSIDFLSYSFSLSS
jgi:hypothetical protein